MNTVLKPYHPLLPFREPARLMFRRYRMDSTRGGGGMNFFFSSSYPSSSDRVHRIAIFLVWGDREIKSATEEKLLSRQPLCSRSLPLRPFVRTTIRSSGTLFPFYDLTSSSLDSTRLEPDPSQLDSGRLGTAGPISTLCSIALLRGEYILREQKNS